MGAADFRQTEVLLERLGCAVTGRRHAHKLRKTVRRLRLRLGAQPWYKSAAGRKNTSKQKKPQGMMHGDGPPYLPGWPAFSPQYPQSVSGLTPASSSASLAALPPKLYPPYPGSGLDSHLSNWYNGALGRHMALDAGYHQSHHGLNGYPASKPDALVNPYKLPEVLASAQHPHSVRSINHGADKAEDPSKLLTNFLGKVNGYSSGDRHTQAPSSGYPFHYPGTSGFPTEEKHATPRNQAEPPPTYEESLFIAKNSLSQPVKGLDLTRQNEQPAHSTSDGLPYSNSTSAGALPIASSADKHMISYYLQGEKAVSRDSPRDDASTDKALRVAAEIMGEANFSMSRKMAAEHQHSLAPSPFSNISNMFGSDPHRQQQQQGKPAFEHLEQHGQISRPQSNQSSHSMDMSQGNTRQENIGFGNKNHNVFNPVTSGAPDFWSQFGLPPPNVVASSQSSQPATAQEFPQPPSVKTGLEQAKVNNKDSLNAGAETVSSRPDQHVFERPEGQVKSADKKRSEKPKRRNSPANPATDEQVNAKVQQILAAIREEQLAQVKQPSAPVAYGHETTQATHPQASRTANINGNNTVNRMASPQVSVQNNSAWKGSMSASVRYPGPSAPVANVPSGVSNRDYHSNAESNKFVRDTSRPSSAEIRHTPQPTDMRNTPQPTDMRNTPQPTDMRHTPQPADIRHTPQPSDIRNTPQPTDMRNTPQSTDIRYTPQPTDMRNTPQPTDIRNTPQPTDIRHTPQPTDMRHTPQPTDMRHTPQPTDIRHTPQPSDIRNTPQPTDIRHIPQPTDLRNAPHQQDFRQATHQQDIRHTPHQQDIRHALNQQDIRHAPHQQDFRQAACQQDSRQTPHQQDSRQAMHQQDIRGVPQQDLRHAPHQQDIRHTPHQQDSKHTPHPTDIRNTPHQQDIRHAPHQQDTRHTLHQQDSRHMPHQQDIRHAPHQQDIRHAPHQQDIRHVPHQQDTRQTPHQQDIRHMTHQQDIRHAPHQQDFRHSSTNGFHGQAPMSLSQQVNEVREMKQEGRLSPCCENCARLGVRFSPHCQNHKKQTRFDPYAFSDEMDMFKERDRYRSFGQKDQAIKQQYLNSEFEKNNHPAILSKSGQPNHLEHQRMDVGLTMDNKTLIQKNLLNEVNRSQGLLASKKAGSKVLNKYKTPGSSYIKKTKLTNKVTVPKKPKNKVQVIGKKAVTKEEEEFNQGLMKNLGFPPLTPEDLILKRQSKLPSHCLNNRGTIASSVLSTEKNCESRAEIPVASHALGIKKEVSGSVPQPGTLTIKEESGEHRPDQCPSEFRHQYRFRSAEAEQYRGVPKGYSPLRRSRSCEELCREKSVHHFEGLDMKVMVDNNECGSVPEPNANMTSVSQHIEGLQKMVMDNKSNLANNTMIEVPKCGCLGPDYVFNESVEGPYYTHLGAGRSVEAIRKMLEHRLGVTGKAIRIEKARYTGKDGKSSHGCPIAKWIIRRANLEEKYLSVLRHRPGHHCETAWLIIGLVAWEGVPRQQADDLYDYLSTNLPENGFETERRCGTNEQKMCACQGADLKKRGASFSFGCSWSMYFNSCKFARSQTVRKFKLKNTALEEPLEDTLQDLATEMGPLYQKCAPEAHSNQSHFSEIGQDCRLGKVKGGPFSGVTACVDFCAHAHKDTHNMYNGSTVVVTLTRHRGLSKPDDEQLHVLPLYVMEPTDEHGSYDGQFEKIQNGALEVLHHYALEARIRSHPLISCKKRRAQAAKSPGRKKRGGAVAANMGRQSPYGSSSSCQSTPKKTKWDTNGLNHSQDSNQSFSSQPGSLGGTPVKQNIGSGNMNIGSGGDRPISYEELMSMSSEAGFEGAYNKFWNYFYTYGAFPPASFIRGQARDGQVGNTGNSNSGVSNPDSKAPKYPDSSAVKQEDMSYKVASKDFGSNVVPFNQNRGAAFTKTADIPQPCKNTVHLTDPFSDRIPHAKSTTQSSTPMAADGATSQADSRLSSPPGQEMRQLPQNGIMDLSSQSSENISSFTPNHPSSSSTPQQPNTQEDFIKPAHPLTSTPTSEQKTSKSPLDLLSMAVEMRTKDVGFSYSMPSRAGPMLPGQEGDHPGNFSREQMGVQPAAGQARPSSAHSADAQFKMPGTSAGERLHTPTQQGNQQYPVAREPAQIKTEGRSLPYPHGQQQHPNGQQQHPHGQQQHPHGQQQQPHGQQQHPHGQQQHPHGQQQQPHGQQQQQQQFMNHQPQTFHHQNSNDYDSSYMNKNVHQNHDLGNKRPDQLMNNDAFNFSRAYHGSNVQGINAGQSRDENQMKSPMRQGYPGFENFMNQEGAQSCPDPDVVKCEMEYNEEAFRDPNLGGVAIALGHGAVLFECAKRELHATTGLKKPDRYKPTRISLVFYQHKNLNYERHGYYAYAKKLENMKRQRMEKMQAEHGFVDMTAVENSFKGGKKRKLVEDEKPEEEYDIMKSSASQYHYMWDCNANRPDAFTTNTMSMKWISPQPMVTGPYQKWV